MLTSSGFQKFKALVFSELVSRLGFKIFKQKKIVKLVVYLENFFKYYFSEAEIKPSPLSILSMHYLMYI